MKYKNESKMATQEMRENENDTKTNRKQETRQKSKIAKR